uniref:G-protein coupled receptors family 1 profile domain-containing protein n=1 Tax=Plectus sambesii TaxID=2011161 RepID=A0A914UZL0_9BILA
MTETVEKALNFSTTSDPDPTSARALGIWFTVIAIIGIPMNLYLVVGSLITKSVRSNPANYFLINLALADTVSLLSCAFHLYYGLFFDELICKICGIGLYMSGFASVMLPPFIAISRYVVIVDQRSSRLVLILKPLFCKVGIIAMNSIVWLYQLGYTIPLLILDKFGLDPIGVCGITKMPSVFAVYYFILVPSSLLALLVCYRKLECMVRRMSSQCQMANVTICAPNRMQDTKNLLKLLKWIALLPLVFALLPTIIEIGLRWNDQFVSIRTGRAVVALFPLSHLVNPFLTVRFSRTFRVLLHRAVVKSSFTNRFFLWLFHYKSGENSDYNPNVEMANV